RFLADKRKVKMWVYLEATGTSPRYWRFSKTGQLLALTQTTIPNIRITPMISHTIQLYSIGISLVTKITCTAMLISISMLSINLISACRQKVLYPIITPTINLMGFSIPMMYTLTKTRPIVVVMARTHGGAIKQSAKLLTVMHNFS